MNTLLEVSGVSVTFDGFRAINNLSFQIAEAEMRAVIGPNGAGKNTFMAGPYTHLTLPTGAPW